MPAPPTIPYDPSAGSSYPSVDFRDIAYVEIFPAIGIARVGNSGSTNGKRSGPVDYFLGPELPQTVYNPVGGYRDGNQAIKRQGARFRVYAYNPDGKLLGEINSKNGYMLEWTVDVANTKAAATIFRGRLDEPTNQLRNPDVQPDLPYYLRDKLIVRPEKPIVISGASKSLPVAGTFQGSRKNAANAVTVDLGDANTDDCGRLIFVGGSGWSECVTEDTGYKPDKEYPEQPDITSEFDNVDWVDSTCDGRVSVSFSWQGSQKQKARHDAWVLSGPPNFTWGINAPTTLWDIIEDVYNKNSQSFVADPNVQFYRDVWPVLADTYRLSWTNKDAVQGHGPGGKGNFLLLENDLKDPTGQRQLREHVFNRIRMPDYLTADQASIKWMPRLSGDGGDQIESGTIQTTTTFKDPITRFSSLTTLQYDRFKRWKNGDFLTAPFPYQKLTKLEDVKPVDLQTEYLSRAHLENTIGDPLFPGIETYWIAKTRDVYDFSVDGSVKPPFRIKRTLHPGDMSKGLSLPWQSDFSQCNTHWWPSSRPDDVVPEGEFVKLVPQVQGSGSGKGYNIAQELDSVPRKPWTRPMRLTPDNDSQFFPGCTDMSRYWELLGFITKITIPNQLPVYVEVQRLLPEPFDIVSSPSTGGMQARMLMSHPPPPPNIDLDQVLGTQGEWKVEDGRIVPKQAGDATQTQNQSGGSSGPSGGGGGGAGQPETSFGGGWKLEGGRLVPA